MENFVVKHYNESPHPIIKGNGFDGLTIGDYREEAEYFINFVNDLINIVNDKVNIIESNTVCDYCERGHDRIGFECSTNKTVDNCFIGKKLYQPK